MDELCDLQLEKDHFRIEICDNLLAIKAKDSD